MKNHSLIVLVLFVFGFVSIYNFSFGFLNFAKQYVSTDIDIYGYENTQNQNGNEYDTSFFSGFNLFDFDNYFSKNVNNSKRYVTLLALQEGVGKYTKIFKKHSKTISYDTYSDSSLYKFVSNRISYNDLKYSPKKLMKIDNKYIINDSSILISEDMQNQLYNLAQLYFEKFGEKLNIISGYRSYEKQIQVFNKCVIKNGNSESRANSWCARPGFSEHQSGLAIDISNFSVSKTDIISAYSKGINVGGLIRKYEKYRWFYNNAYKYGFHNSYQKGFSVDGYNSETWHWRYLGTDLAKYLHENDISYTQFNNGFLN